ncbi:hypothetical protein RND81_13G129500 [Saponaria officinalis]|uniref:Uncharacterized protein n=1 Tax=Saponaria officinalis TaxID=3572 RepID=A0AAW1GXE3_SAPOF
MRFVWKKKRREWIPRQRGFSIGRIYHIFPGSGERYYLRTLLNFVKGPTSFEDIRTINGVLACYALGLLGDDKEYIDAIIEASFWGSSFYLRSLFATLLLSGSVAKPEIVWEKTWHLLSDDILYKRRTILQNQELQLSDDELKTYALLDIEAALQSNGSSLQKFDDMPFPDDLSSSEHVNKLILDELSYDKDALFDEHARLISSLTDEQRSIYQEIMDAVRNGRGGVFSYMDTVALGRHLYGELYVPP